jgi:hypothetical protein
MGGSTKKCGGTSAATLAHRSDEFPAGYFWPHGFNDLSGPSPRWSTETQHHRHRSRRLLRNLVNAYTVTGFLSSTGLSGMLTSEGI